MKKHPITKVYVSAAPNGRIKAKAYRGNKKDEPVLFDTVQNFFEWPELSEETKVEFTPKGIIPRMALPCEPIFYFCAPDEIKDLINLDNWINGETGGYLRVTREERNWFETDFPKILAEPAKKLDGSERSKEHASYIIESLETGRHYRGHFNIMNEGCITNLPWESVVEVPCYVDGNGISIPKVGDLPLGCAAVCSQSIWVQKLAIEAAVHGNVQLLKQAAMMDPLTGAVCNPPEIWQMIDEMLVAQEQWLPQYTEAIKAAKEHLANDPLIPTKDYHGAARLREKTPEEVAAERDARKITA